MTCRLGVFALSYSSASTMAGEFFSIGEVLAMLLEEFPDVTISKIRFLESQGLIAPERTTAGYRKFTAEEIERLRFILREQKDNFLPLRVIRDRLEGETSDSLLRPDDVTDAPLVARVASERRDSAAGDAEKLLDDLLSLGEELRRVILRNLTGHLRQPE
ncbi:MAG: MerR family transcriptional regulator [Actinobacteria bacterium]|nr:MerR family transcriptional regulator [Actinomycetota bacterium]